MESARTADEEREGIPITNVHFDPKTISSIPTSLPRLPKREREI